MSSGIAPRALVAQVKNTAAWLWEPGSAERAAAARALDALEAAEQDHAGAAGAPPHAYLRLLLAAHYATVATFVPTDVDARIRHHQWVALSSEEELEGACDVVDEIAALDPRAVSARVVETKHGLLSGHDGEWFSVRSGALGRALALGATRVVERLVAVLDAEVERHRAISEEALERKAKPQHALEVCTTVAHNLGDLSRVVDQWPKRGEHEALRVRYLRLGHADAPRADAAVKTFATVGVLNKALMARENHRYLALRKPRALRASRELLLPFGPWLDAWGERVATHEALEERDRAEVVEALLELHESDPEAQACLRGLAGIHRATRGGLALYADRVAARLRKGIGRGAVREAVDVDRARFEAKLDKRYALERGWR